MTINQHCDVTIGESHGETALPFKRQSYCVLGTLKLINQVETARRSENGNTPVTGTAGITSHGETDQGT